MPTAPAARVVRSLLRQGARFALLAALLCLPACQSSRSAEEGGGDALYQVSLIDALLAGDYDGHATVGHVTRHGDFGIGTFDKLHGEMVVLDGVVYRAAADGSVATVSPEETTPFAAVARFTPDRRVTLAPAENLEALHGQLDKKLGNLNLFYAIRIRATPAYLKLRSVPAQRKPYRPLAQVVVDQSVWEHRGVAGVFVGLRCPVFSRGVNVPGFHWHFVSDDRRIAGHVLEAQLPATRAAVDELRAWRVDLPGDDRHRELDLGADRSRQLESVEK